MTFGIVPSPKVEGILGKMWQKDPTRFSQIEKKLLELGENTEIGKPLKKPLKGFSRGCTVAIEKTPVLDPGFSGSRKCILPWLSEGAAPFFFKI